MTQESQFELFNSKPPSYGPTERLPFVKPNLVLTFDHTIILSIILLLLMVFSFSLGVERGKRVASAPQAQFHQDRKATATRTQSAARPAAGTQKLTSEQSAQQHKTNDAVGPAPAVAPAIAPPAAPAAPSPDQDMYTVQVASFKQEKHALQEAMNLKQKGYEIYVLPKGQHSIVCVGKFIQKKEAAAMSAKLRKYYKDCLVRNL